MTTTLDMQKSGKFGLDNKVIGLGVAVYSLIEAIFAYFFLFKPLYIDPVYLKCDEYNADGITCLVKFFGKTLATPDEIANNQVILSMWDTISNIIIIYLVATVSALLLAFCMFKGMSFAKTYFVAFFGAKHILGVMAVLVPMINMRRSTMIFALVDALFSIALCLFFITLTNEEYADDMLFTDDQITAMNKRMKFGFILYGPSLLFVTFEKFGMTALGKNKTLFLDWSADTTALTPTFKQGIVLIALLAVALVAAVVYIKEADWAVHFYAAFGIVATISNLVALVKRFIWLGGLYAPWVAPVICLCLATVAAAAVAFFALMKLKSSMKFKIAPEDKKPAFAVLISAGSVLLSFIFTIVGLALFIGQRNPGISYGAMDYLYFIVYGGLSLFLAIAMWAGYSFTKLGSLVVFLVMAASNFSMIFTVLEHRQLYIANEAANGYIVVGYNHLIAVVMLVLSIVSCFGIIAAFAVKGVNDYMYEKRFS